MAQGHIVETINGAQHIYAASYDIDADGNPDFTYLTMLYCTSLDPDEVDQLRAIFEELTSMYQVE